MDADVPLATSLGFDGRAKGNARSASIMADISVNTLALIIFG